MKRLMEVIRGMACSGNGYPPLCGTPLMVNFEYDTRLSVYENVDTLITEIRKMWDTLCSYPDLMKSWIAENEKYLQDNIERLNGEWDDFKTLMSIRMNGYNSRFNIMEASWRRTQKEFEKQYENIALRYEDQIDAYRQLTKAEIDALKKYVDEEIADMNALYARMNQTVQGMYFFIDTNILASESRMRQEFADYVAKQNGNLISVTSPVDGLYKTLDTVLDEIYGETLFLSISAKDYDAIGFTAEQYDALGYTAKQYDTRAWELTFPQRYLDPVFEYVDRQDGKLYGMIDLLDTQVNYRLSPVSGRFTSLYQMIQELTELHQERAFAAEEYDRRGLEAQIYDNRQISAWAYDSNGLDLV